jgi:hypothetical protein
MTMTQKQIASASQVAATVNDIPLTAACGNGSGCTASILAPKASREYRIHW